ncbi:DUF1648 domain-containing protein [Alteribacter aurantiacus]|uniref:DUF1648 domain-containing protein n=1 Tax=Alteribacter aurantiacus TaxID=254410 RepID=UPI00047DC732|nr:DUF1648 domain-containing protein [Alteribacter aurantiacus]
MKKSDIFLFVFNGIMVLAMFGLAMSYWPLLPDQIPSNFGLNGEVRSEGGKGLIYLLPGISAFFVVLSVPSYYYPQAISLPMKLSYEEKEQMKDLLSPYMLKVITLFVVFFFICCGKRSKCHLESRKGCTQPR